MDITDINFSIISLLISTLSLSISALTWYRQRKRLDVTWGDNIFILDPKTDVTVHGSAYPIKSDVGFYGTVDIVNPSSHNISFFDLRVFNPETNANHYLLSKRTMIIVPNDHTVVVSPFPENKFFVTIPDRNFGLLKAGSFTSIDIVAFANPNTALGNKIRISFKVADTAWFKRDKFSVTNRKKYEEHHFTYSIEGYEKVLMEKSNVNRDQK